jgi:hypothetical protein
VHPSLKSPAHASDGEELGIDDVQKIAGRKAIGRVEDIGFTPSDELLADVDCQPAARDGGGRATNRQTRALDPAVAKIDAPRVLDLIV